MIDFVHQMLLIKLVEMTIVGHNQKNWDIGNKEEPYEFF